MSSSSTSSLKVNILCHFPGIPLLSDGYGGLAGFEKDWSESPPADFLRVSLNKATDTPIFKHSVNTDNISSGILIMYLYPIPVPTKPFD